MSRKKTLIWAGAINFVAAAFFVYCVVMLINNIDGFADELKTMLSTTYGYTSEQVAVELNASVIEFITCAATCGVCGLVNFGFIFLTDFWFAKLKWLSVTIAVVNTIIGGNFVSGLLFVVAATRKQQPQMVGASVGAQTIQQPIRPLTNEQIKEHLKLKSMAEKIEIVKHLKAEGSINDAEYIKLVDEIISNGVKE